MASLKKREHAPDASGRRALKGFYIVFYDASRRPAEKEVPAGVRDRRAAEARRVEAERAQALGLYDPWTEPPPWTVRSGSGLTAAEAVERFLASREGSAAGLATYRAVFGAFVRTLPAGLMLADLSGRHVERFLAAPTGRPVSARTATSYRQRLGIFARWCHERKLVRAEWGPVADAPRTKDARAAEDVAPKYYTAGEVQRLVAVIAEAYAAAPCHYDAVLLDLVPLLFLTGLRRAEAVALRWSAVQIGTPAGSFVTVEPSEGFTPKSGRRRAVPLYGQALAILQRRMQERPEDAQPSDPVFPAAGVRSRKGERPRPLYGPALTRRLRQHVRAAGLRPDEADGTRGRALHSLRHGFGTEAMSRGISPAAVQSAMGHSRMETTQVYAKMLPSGLYDEFARVFGAASPPAPSGPHRDAPSKGTS